MTDRLQQALANFQAAREHYIARRFAEARATIPHYQQAIDYNQFEQQDNRAEANPEISIIVVSYAVGPKMLDCFKSVLAQQGPRFKIIRVDNGDNQNIPLQLAQLPISLISPSIFRPAKAATVLPTSPAAKS